MNILDYEIKYNREAGNNFAVACYDQNTKEELQAELTGEFLQANGLMLSRQLFRKWQRMKRRVDEVDQLGSLPGFDSPAGYIKFIADGL